MKHVGKMKNNSARLAVVYRTLPGDPHHALVVGTQGLGDSYHDTLINIIESPNGQEAYELADILATRKFPDGSVMLGFLHSNGHLKRVPTNMVLMTPDTQTQLPLDELNKIIAEQRGCTIDDLAVNDGTGNRLRTPVKPKPSQHADAYSAPPVEVVNEPVSLVPAAEPVALTAEQMRARADTLLEEAQRLRNEADILDPKKSKKKSNTVQTA